MSMTIQEAIKRINQHMSIHHIGQHPHIHLAEALHMALDALREKEERDNPQPLTINDLLKMHGEPVYVTVPGKPHRNKWCIVEVCSPQPGLHGIEYFCHLCVVDTCAVKVYRHKPKEVQE